jgi:hypothetical protein
MMADICHHSHFLWFCFSLLVLAMLPKQGTGNSLPMEHATEELVEALCKAREKS